MEQRIEEIKEKKIVGKRIQMKLSNNKTFELWHSFMRERKRIRNNINQDLLSIQVYDPLMDFKDFTPDTLFEKWAGMEVLDFNEIPSAMESFILPGGMYVVFKYRGSSNDFEPAFNYIFKNWIPNSIYIVDNRPHFEIMGEKYKTNHPDSEEELWIPIRLK